LLFLLEIVSVVFFIGRSRNSQLHLHLLHAFNLIRTCNVDYKLSCGFAGVFGFVLCLTPRSLQYDGIASHGRLSVCRLSHSCTICKLFDGFTCHLAPTGSITRLSLC